MHVCMNVCMYKERKRKNERKKDRTVQERRGEERRGQDTHGHMLVICWFTFGPKQALKFPAKLVPKNGLKHQWPHV